MKTAVARCSTHRGEKAGDEGKSRRVIFFLMFVYHFAISFLSMSDVPLIKCFNATAELADEWAVRLPWWMVTASLGMVVRLYLDALGPA